MSTLRVNTVTDVAGTGETDAAQIGVGQTWQDVSASRAASTTYTNSTSRPIQVAIGLNTTGPGTRVLTISGLGIPKTLPNATDASVSFEAIIPIGATYSFSGSFSYWYELR